MYKLKIAGKFDAAHFLPGVEICRRLHGHTWKVEIELQHDKLQNNCMLVDFREVKESYKKYDHQSLNDYFPFPTAECLAYHIYMDLAKTLNLKAKINYVRVWESEDCYAEYATAY